MSTTLLRLPPSLPSIHGDGTPIDDLVSAAQADYRAVTLAIDSIVSHAPQSRDYYPQGVAAFQRAKALHATRIARLDLLAGEMHDALQAIEAGGFVRLPPASR